MVNIARRSELALEKVLNKEYSYHIAKGIKRFGLTAFKHGWRDAEAGKSDHAYPYSDKRTHRGSVTFSRAYIRRWETGWRAYHEWETSEAMKWFSSRYPHRSEYPEKCFGVFKEGWDDAKANKPYGACPYNLFIESEKSKILGYPGCPDMCDRMWLAGWTSYWYWMETS